MILEGPSIDLQSTFDNSAAVSISQLIVYNSLKHNNTVIRNYYRKNKAQETPLPISVAMYLHAKTRKRSLNLIDTFYELGLCISYDHLMTVSTQLANGVCDRFELSTVDAKRAADSRCR